MTISISTTQPKGHLTSKERKATGAHYTPVEMADFLAWEITTALESTKFPKSRPIRILDPAIGDGVLLNSLAKSLQSKKFINIESTGFDIDGNALDVAADTLGPKVAFWHEDFLTHVLDSRPTFTNDCSVDNGQKQYELVISNPPYIRTQLLGATESKRLSDAFGLSGRIDIYHAFLKAISLVLVSGGIVGLIVSNRFMTTQAGSAARSLIKKEFDILHVWDLGDTRLFKAAVLPALLLLRKKGEGNHAPDSKMTTVYSANGAKASAKSVENIFSVINSNGIIRTERGAFLVQNGKLNSGPKSWDTWRLSNEVTDNWLRKVAEQTHCLFSDIGKIKVGIKTTADKVFIRDDWGAINSERPELLQDVITHHVADHFKSRKVERQVLYPHESVAGRKRPVDITNYPKSLKYLEQHRSALEGRTYITSAGRNWYEIWVPQNPDEWKQPKIVFRDISKEPYFWLDESGAVVNGDCYWINCGVVDRNLIYLALAVANSKFITCFYDRMFNNKLYAERRRFMTQYVKEFPIPDPKNSYSKKIVSCVDQLMRTSVDKSSNEQLQEKINSLVWRTFGLQSCGAMI